MFNVSVNASEAVRITIDGIYFKPIDKDAVVMYKGK